MSLCLLCGIIMYDCWGIDLALCVHFFLHGMLCSCIPVFWGHLCNAFSSFIFFWFLRVGWLALFQLEGLTSALRSLFAGRLNGKETTLGLVPVVGKWGATILSHSLALWRIFYHSFPPFNKNSILYHFFWFLTIPYNSFPSFFTLSERRILHSLQFSPIPHHSVPGKIPFFSIPCHAFPILPVSSDSLSILVHQKEHARTWWDLDPRPSTLHHLSKGVSLCLLSLCVSIK